MKSLMNMLMSLAFVTGIAGIALIVANIAALIQHIFYSASSVADKGLEAILWLIFGIVPFPLVGILHGWFIWLAKPWF